ncbi:uracil-DNA glycosylase family protein [Seohaeicola nanhaiensis]|uniref:Type-4 uracil-DNA glycosylase n=1 Tax=Seohaeicola nanhaiensis TaxID=1387282 RepID=A0ABV9KD03_9RHOB
MESALDFHTARALLEWQIELGATEAICDAPVDRYALTDVSPSRARAAAAAAAPPTPFIAPEADPLAEARDMARAAATLDDLRDAMGEFDHCELKKGARNLVFCDGKPGSRVMLIGEAPGRDEDLQGKPFVGRAGQLLDRMLDAIGLSRRDSVYITNVLPWRPPQNRDPRPDEVAMLLPFLERHVQLAAPDVLVLMGNISCDAVLGRRGITRLRGQWTEAWGKPALPMFHPAYLLRQPGEKKKAWADLLDLNAWLEDNR